MRFTWYMWYTRYMRYLRYILYSRYLWYIWYIWGICCICGICGIWSFCFDARGKRHSERNYASSLNIQRNGLILHRFMDSFNIWLCIGDLKGTFDARGKRHSERNYDSSCLIDSDRDSHSTRTRTGEPPSQICRENHHHNNKFVGRTTITNLSGEPQ